MKFLKIAFHKKTTVATKGTEVFSSCVTASVSYAAKHEQSSSPDLWVTCWLDYYVEKSCKDTVKETHLYCCEDESTECVDGKWFLKEDTLMKRMNFLFLNESGEELSV